MLKSYEELANVNSKIKTMPLGKKEYAPVHERIKAFRTLEPDGDINTEIIAQDEKTITIRATIYASDGRRLATGHAHEEKGKGMVNSTSHVENCETSAVGRALANLGIGIDAAFTSADEMAEAINRQHEEIAQAMEKPDAKINKKQVQSVMDQCAVDGVSIKQICDLMGVEAVTDLTFPQYWALTNNWSEKVEKIKGKSDVQS